MIVLVPLRELWSALMSARFAWASESTAGLLIAGLVPLAGTAGWAVTQAYVNQEICGTYLEPTSVATELPFAILATAIIASAFILSIITVFNAAETMLRCWWPVLLAVSPVAVLVGMSIAVFNAATDGPNFGAGLLVMPWSGRG